MSGSDRQATDLTVLERALCRHVIEPVQTADADVTAAAAAACAV